MSDGDEKEIYIGCCKGDRSAQEAFVRRFSNLVYSTVLQTCKARGAEGPDLNPDDLHNTVFLRLLERRCRRLRQFKGKNGCSLASWVRVITVRTVIDHLRQRKDALSHPTRLDTDEPLVRLQADIPEPWQLLDQYERQQMIRAALASLRPRDRLLIKLHCLQDLPLREVAGILNVTENNAYSMKHRAIKRLKAVIEKKWRPT
jgi:RNA polymerase sigma factor (sigma-70 family)